MLQELFGGKHYQAFEIEDVSRKLVDIWLGGMLPQSACLARQESSPALERAASKVESRN